MSISSKIESLITAANSVTGESRTDLTSAVQDLKDGYGGSTVEKGLVFSEYDSDGFPTKLEFKGMTEIPDNCFYSGSGGILTGGFLKNLLRKVEIPNTIARIGNSAFRNCLAFGEPFTIPSSVTAIGVYAFGSNTTFQTLIFEGNVPNISAFCFANCNQMTLADFSNHTGTIPSLYSADSFQGKSGSLVIKVPQSLLAEWSTATNWVNVNATWQGV